MTILQLDFHFQSGDTVTLNAPLQDVTVELNVQPSVRVYMKEQEVQRERFLCLQLSPDQVCFLLSSTSKELRKRCQYLDFSLVCCLVFLVSFSSFWATVHEAHLLFCFYLTVLTCLCSCVNFSCAILVFRTLHCGKASLCQVAISPLSRSSQPPLLVYFSQAKQVPTSSMTLLWESSSP